MARIKINRSLWENNTKKVLLKNTIQKHLAEFTSIELAGQVFDILDNSNLVGKYGTSSYLKKRRRISNRTFKF